MTAGVGEGGSWSEKAEMKEIHITGPDRECWIFQLEEVTDVTHSLGTKPDVPKQNENIWAGEKNLCAHFSIRLCS